MARAAAVNCELEKLQYVKREKIINFLVICDVLLQNDFPGCAPCDAVHIMGRKNTMNDPFVSDLFDQYDQLVARARSCFSFTARSCSAYCNLIKDRWNCFYVRGPHLWEFKHRDARY